MRTPCHLQATESGRAMTRWFDKSRSKPLALASVRPSYRHGIVTLSDHRAFGTLGSPALILLAAFGLPQLRDW